MRYKGLELDAFQEKAVAALRQGRDVVVSAPTGAGKTLIAEYAIDLALERSRGLIYTAPIKAISSALQI